MGQFLKAETRLPLHDVICLQGAWWIVSPFMACGGVEQIALKPFTCKRRSSNKFNVLPIKPVLSVKLSTAAGTGSGGGLGGGCLTCRGGAPGVVFHVTAY